jgi:hypothetical protein
MLSKGPEIIGSSGSNAAIFLVYSSFIYRVFSPQFMQYYTQFFDRDKCYIAVTIQSLCGIFFIPVIEQINIFKKGIRIKGFL